ncbi:hypothetical protein ACS0ZG_26610 [Burkholderia gladioli]
MPRIRDQRLVLEAAAGSQVFRKTVKRTASAARLAYSLASR